MEKTFKVVIVPSTKPSMLYMGIDKKLYFEDYFVKPNQWFAEGSKLIPYHIYIISDENINNGDWCLDFDGHTIYQSTDKTSDSVSNKIISSTDESITPYSWIQTPFTNQYIKYYNEGNPIADIHLHFSQTPRDTHYVAYAYVNNTGYPIVNYKEYEQKEKDRDYNAYAVKKLKIAINYLQLKDMNVSQVKEWIKNNI